MAMNLRNKPVCRGELHNGLNVIRPDSTVHKKPWHRQLLRRTGSYTNSSVYLSSRHWLSHHIVGGRPHMEWGRILTCQSGGVQPWLLGSRPSEVWSWHRYARSDAHLGVVRPRL